MRLKRVILSLCVCIATLCASDALGQNHTHEWLEAKSISGNYKAVSSQPEMEVFSAPNTVMVKVNRETEVRLFTILGKLVLSQKLAPGIYEYRIDSHGIYIVKTDENSCKVAV